ncbi:arsenate reductase (glutaredoxin) [Magnetovibrio blakemorei]|uniref:Arsenate reductase n=1 Tax=Magnetovibrio blakemorei TaxID=28181 RepID=A0A1E5QB22_9PROT|nr:arsenate reductase (glutaredoxin) [Magnetovibrio blakemorei]OEJ69230.1 arsenate reductase (glutaredoxin) [Magnetovibrio blakemorei]
MSVTIYHNPRCSKSRTTLELIREKGIEPNIVEYLETPPSAAELKDLLTKLGLKAKDIVRKKEAGEEGIDVAALDNDALIKALVAHPRAIERPIVVKGAKAVMGRPPENVINLL